MKIIAILMNAIVVFVIVGLVSGFDNLVRNPITTILFFGFDLGRLLVGWGLDEIGWMVGIVLTTGIWIGIAAGIYAIYKWARKNFSTSPKGE
ncbi:MAG: hypothetical protein FWE16_05650 [Firmicutes bacterium]|nr:hypothetical protein [Bacillota bacterium]